MIRGRCSNAVLRASKLNTEMTDYSSQLHFNVYAIATKFYGKIAGGILSKVNFVPLSFGRLNLRTSPLVTHVGA